MAKGKAYGNISLQQIFELPYEQKVEKAQALAKAANKRLRALEKAHYTRGNTAYKKAMNELKQMDKKAFYTGSKYESEILLDLNIATVATFLNAKGSTKEGAKKAKEAHEKRIKTFTNKHGIDLSTEEKQDQFFDFLNSQRFKDMSKTMDSNQVMLDFENAIFLGVNENNLYKQYDAYLQENKPIDIKMRKRRNQYEKKEGMLIDTATSTKSKKQKRKRN